MKKDRYTLLPEERFSIPIFICVSLLIMISLIQSACHRNRPAATKAVEMSTLIRIPSVSGQMIIDGKPDEAFWQSVMPLHLSTPLKDLPEDGGQIRLALRGKYLCLAAQLPDSGRLVAHSAGVNPSWWREDMIIWMIRYQSPLIKRNTAILFAINPFGAYSLGAVKDIYNISGNEIYSAVPLEWSEEILAASAIKNNGWSVEAAIPLGQLGTAGFISAERIRVPRLNSPEVRWQWPANSIQAGFELSAENNEPAPGYIPSELPGNNLSVDDNVTDSKPAELIKSIPGDVWPVTGQESDNSRQQMENSVRLRIKESAEKERAEWKMVRSKEDWENFRDIRLKELYNTIGPLPEKTPLRAEVTRRIDPGSGFVIENILFESRPGLPVTANLYLPGRMSGKIPAVVVIHSHHAPKTQSELQDMGMTWAKNGTAVLIMDQLCSGERIQSQPWPRESYYGRYATGNQLYIAGEYLIKWMAWDIIRGIDLLSERNYIDGNRIIVLGAVAGGGDPAALAAVLDSRIKAVIPFNFGEAGPEEHYTEGPRPYDFETADPGWAFWETTRNLPNSVSGQFFPWFLCASVAPRHLIYSIEIGWPNGVEAEPAWARYKKVFGFYDATDNLASVSGFGPFPGPGECTNVGSFLRGRIYPVLSKWFNIPVPASEYHNLLPETELMCLTPSSLKERALKPASLIALEIVKKSLDEAEASRSLLPAGEEKKALCSSLREKLGEIDPDGIPRVQKIWSKKYPAFTVQALSVETEKGITTPVLFLNPSDLHERRKPAILAFAQGGKKRFLQKRAGEIADLLNSGIAVCLPDLRGTGEISISDSRGPGAMSIAANELMLGRTMTGLQVRDARSVFQWLRNQPDLDPECISLWGDSFSEPNTPGFMFDMSPGQQPGPVPQRQAEPMGPFIALLTALFEDNVRAVACRGGLISFSSVLQDNFCHVPQDIIVPGLLKVCDIRDIVGSVIPRPVLIAGSVDGLNRKVASGIVEQEYKSILSEVTLSDNAEKKFISAWLKEICLKPGKQKDK
jgi:dienelactone hydrolase